MHESLNKFKPYVEKKLIREVISPCGKLILWNYTDLCTYERAWDDVTLNARGTVYEIETGKIIARAFPKFFNFGELSDDKQQEVLNSSSFETFEKMDGSLGIIYFYDGEWRVNTRGSFTSDQVVKGKEMLDDMYNLPALNKKHTYLVEIIYPENRIIVDYGEVEKLSFLAAHGTRSGLEEHDHIRCMEIDLVGFHMGDSVEFMCIEQLQQHLATLDHTEEGYVVRLASGERVKFKSRAYLDLARIMQYMTPLAFWKTMENGKVNREYMQHLPEEFREESEKIAVKLEEKYVALADHFYESFEDNFTRDTERRDIGIKSKEKGLQTSAMFAILDKKVDVIDRIIMKELRPHGNTMEI